MNRKLLISLALVACIPGCTKQTLATTAPTQPAPAPQVTPVATAPIEAADLIEVQATAANRFVSAGEADTALVRVAVKARSLEGQPRPPANVALLVDTSASMRGEAIEQARAAAVTMLETLETGDRLSLVAFHSSVDVLVPSTVIDEDSVQAIRTAMESMEATGTTAMGEGLMLAGKEVKRFATQDNVSRIVMLSDGLPNNEVAVEHASLDVVSKGIAVTALGLGIEYHEGLLARLATESGGRFHHVEGPQQVAAMFQDEVLHLERLVATQAQITLTCGPGVTIDEIVGWPNVAAGSSDTTITVGDLAENEVKNVVVRLAVDGRANGSTVELLDARVTYGDPVTKAGVVQRDAFLAVEATDDAAIKKTGADVETEVVVARALAAAALLAVVAQARSGRLKVALAKLRTAEKNARAMAKRTEDPELVALAAEMSRLAKTLPSLVPPKPAATPRRKKGLKRNKHAAHSPRPAPRPQREFGQAGSKASLKRSHSRAFNALY